MILYRDNLSGLKLVELGAGLTINDISILAWTPIFTNRTATLTHKIDVPDGHRAFIRLRATNHGKFFYDWFFRTSYYIKDNQSMNIQILSFKQE